MEGTIQHDGSVLGDDGKSYYPMRHKDTILIECSSWARMDISDVLNRRVQFLVSTSGKGYNYKLIE